MDASIAAKAEFEYLYDRPYQDNRKVRVAGPFTVESLSPHRILGVDEEDELIDTLRETGEEYGDGQSFVPMILENLRTSGVQQAHKQDRIEFTSLVPWPGELVCAEGRYFEGEGAGPEKRAAVFIGPEFGTMSRPDLVKAAREAGDGEHITDWDAGIRRMEEGVPAYEPGTGTGYHAVTYGWIVGGIVQGATGRHIKDVIREEIAEPLGVADEMYVGIPEKGVEDRLTTLDILPAGEGMPIPDDADFYKAMPKAMWLLFNTMPFRVACLPSGNGHFTARALARMYAALANGGQVDGVRLVSPERITKMQRLMTTEVDRVLGMPMAKGIGFFFGGEADGIHGPIGPRRTAFGHPGAGGSVAFADPDVNLSVAVTLNRMSAPLPGEGVTLEICDLIRSQLGVE